MKPSQLCLLYDKTDSKSKWVKKTDSMVGFVKIVYFVKLSICDALSKLIWQCIQSEGIKL